jgi:hypothetical protein
VRGNVVAVLSGGNIALDMLAHIIVPAHYRGGAGATAL